MVKVVKFGGSSVATGACFETVKNIVEADPARALVVVSAPGKRFSADIKVTDLLYLLRAHIKYNAPYDEILAKIKTRYYEICADCNIDNILEDDFKEFESKLNKKTSVDYIVSRGEYWCAKIMAKYLGYTFVDSADWLVFNYNGRVNLEASYQNLAKIAETAQRIVFPGFYGAMPDGNIKTFSRGGSDITGSLVAAALNVTAYENWTDVSGILAADPRIVENPRPIDRVTFSELRELSYMGAEVLHEEAVFPVRNKNIPLYIKNTKDINAPGTLIMEDFDEDRTEQAKIRPITGISGRKHYSIITISKSRMDEEPGCIRKVLAIFEANEINVEQVPCSIDTFSVIVAGDALDDKLHAIITRIEQEIQPDSIKITNDISLIAVVGRNLTENIGIAGKIFTALGENGINIRVISQGSDEVNIIIGVDDINYKKAIRVLHDF
ncbi:MAG: aspartate kinase [Clostridia bacterium]|nr:aspartate kinase [Clostridia bacterium]